MKIAIGSDHGGFELKNELAGWLASEGYEVEDCGPADGGRVDYPDYAAHVARAVSGGQADQGVLVCGSGIGMSIAANKFAGVRAAVVQDTEHARLAREHNNANILCLGARFTASELARSIVQTWLQAECEGERHHARIAKITALDTQSE